MWEQAMQVGMELTVNVAAAAVQADILLTRIFGAVMEALALLAAVVVAAVAAQAHIRAVIQGVIQHKAKMQDPTANVAGMASIVVPASIPVMDGLPAMVMAAAAQAVLLQVQAADFKPHPAALVQAAY